LTKFYHVKVGVTLLLRPPGATLEVIIKEEEEDPVEMVLEQVALEAQEVNLPEAEPKPV
jgi:hypothetical protein